MATTSTRREKVSYMDSHWDTSYQYDTHDPPVGYFPNFSLSFTKRPKIEIKRYDQTSQIQFKIGNKNLLVDIRLYNLIESIKESQKLLYLEEDWDEDGAIAINPIIYFRAIETLIGYATNVLNLYNVCIPLPYISASRDGSIDLHWNESARELLITILNTPDFNLHYYGDDGNNNTVSKGTLNSEKINEDLSHWMRKL